MDRLLHGVAAIHGDVIDRSLDGSKRSHLSGIGIEVGGQIGVAIERRHPATRLMMGPDCGTAIRRFTFESLHVVRDERLSTRCDGPEGIGAIISSCFHPTRHRRGGSLPSQQQPQP